MTFDFSAEFDDQFEAFFREAAAEQAATKAPKAPTVDPAWEALPDRCKALLTRAGISYGGDAVWEAQGPAARSLPALDAPKRLSPTGGKNGDNFATARNLSRHKFVLTVIASAASNKGWVSLEDVAALHIGCGVGNFASARVANDYSTTGAIAADLHRKLQRRVETKGDRLMIPGLKEHRKVCHLSKVANSIITSVKSRLKSEAKV